MPLPNQKKGQEQKEFISRCMSNETMEKEFSDPKQRSAVCYSKYKQTKKAKGGLERNQWVDTPVSWDDAKWEIENYPYIFY
jgi:hypothetical protein